MSRAFNIGDKVFAKVRGYPAWPARIEKKIEGSSNKLKYLVLFYGTAETAVCKIDDIFHYEEFKLKYGKPLKRRGFLEALNEIEGITDVQKTSKKDEFDSDVEGNLIIDEDSNADSKPPEGEKKKKGIKRKRESGFDHLDDKSVNANVSRLTKPTSVPSSKRFKRGSVSHKETNGTSSSAGSSDSSARSSPFKPEIISRSGRKIKPKKFADEEVFNHSISSIDAESSQKPNTDVKEKKSFHEKQSGSSSNGTSKRQNRLSVKTPAALNNSISEPSRSTDNNTGNPSTPNGGRAVLRDRLTWFRTEAGMLEIETKLKSNLGINKANTAESINLLSSLNNLQIEPLMLKKHPVVLKTIRKLRRYVGNASEWNLTDSEEKGFLDNAKVIREKCDYLYNKFKALFNVPDGTAFWDVFVKAVEEFKRKTEALDVEKICALTVDPTVVTENGVDTDSLPEDARVLDQTDSHLEIDRLQTQEDAQPDVGRLQDQAESQTEEMVSQPSLLANIKTEPLDTDEDSEAPENPSLTIGNATAIGKTVLKTEAEKDKDSQTIITVKVEKELTN